jgi:hypothetical protein
VKTETNDEQPDLLSRLFIALRTAASQNERPVLDPGLLADLARAYKSRGVSSDYSMLWNDSRSVLRDFHVLAIFEPAIKKCAQEIEARERADAAEATLAEIVSRNYLTDEDDEDDDEVEIDDAQTDAEIRMAILDRINCHHGQLGPMWTAVAQTDESVTVALETPAGCLVRVIHWDLDDLTHHNTTWCPGLRLDDLRVTR